MIYLTVGTQLPFDRLVQAFDAWAAEHPGVACFAQVGPTTQPPRAMPWAEFVPPSRADALMRECELVVAHAGMGSILTALQYGKPIVIVPRRAALGEHRNDHQLATARWMSGRPGVAVLEDEAGLSAVLGRRASLAAGEQLPPLAQGALVERLRGVIFGARG